MILCIKLVQKHLRSEFLKSFSDVDIKFCMFNLMKMHDVINKIKATKYNLIKIRSI